MAVLDTIKQQVQVPNLQQNGPARRVASGVLSAKEVRLNRTPFYATPIVNTIPLSTYMKGKNILKLTLVGATLSQGVFSRVKSLSGWVLPGLFVAWWAVPGSTYVIKKVMSGGAEDE
jgi:hypothetical protein